MSKRAIELLIMWGWAALVCLTLGCELEEPVDELAGCRPLLCD